MIKFSIDNDEVFIDEVKKELKRAKKSMSRCRQAFQSLKAWVDTRAKEIVYNDESAFGVLKAAFDKSGNPKTINDDDIEFSVDTLTDYFNTINAADLKGSSYEINANLSANLMRLMGKTGDYNFDGKISDWKAPKTYGLQNSDRIIKRSSRQSPREPLNKHNGNNVRKKKNIEESSEDDYSESSESEDDDARVARIASMMSTNLLKALGMDVPNAEVNSTWKPPSASGLSNSRPIVPLAPEKPSHDSKNRSYRRNDKYQNTRSENSRVQILSKYQESESDDDDDDDMSNEADEDDIVERLTSKMSANLLKALGKSVIKAQSPISWKPPSRPGLSNSVPLMPKKNHRNIRFREKNSEDVVDEDRNYDDNIDDSNTRTVDNETHRNRVVVKNINENKTQSKVGPQTQDLSNSSRKDNRLEEKLAMIMMQKGLPQIKANEVESNEDKLREIEMSRPQPKSVDQDTNTAKKREAKLARIV